MGKGFTSLFEKLTGKEDKLLRNIIAEIERAEEEKKRGGVGEEQLKESGLEIRKEEKIGEEIGEKEVDFSAIGKIFELEEARERAERAMELIREELERREKEEKAIIELPSVEIPSVEVLPPESIAEAKAETLPEIQEIQEIKAGKEVAPKELEMRAEGEEGEERLQKAYEKSEELLSEEKAYRKITERVEGRKKVVEGAEDLKRKIVISIDIDEGEISGKEAAELKREGTPYLEEPLKYSGQNGKINSMEKGKEGAEELEVRGRAGGNVIIQEIINRIRSDIIAKSEVEAKKRIDEAEKRAKEIIDNAYKESERIINEAVSRSLDISREIEKEAEDKGYKVGYEKGYKDGLEKGHEEGYKKALSEARYALELIRKVADEVSYAKEKFSDDFPKIVLHLTLVALKTILMTNFVKDEELVIRVVKDALEKVKDFKIVKIKLNKADVELVKKYFDLPQDIEIVPAPDVERGDVKIEMKEGYFESTIKWREKIIEDVLKGELLNLSREDYAKEHKSESIVKDEDVKVEGEEKKET